MKKKHLEISSFCTGVPQMTIIWCMVPEISSATDRILCHLWLFFPFYPPNNSENENFGKIKTMPGDIIILHMCTINENHMMHDSCDMERDRQNFFSFWTIFWPFTPHTKPENQNFEKTKKKNAWDIIILHKCTININHMMYCSWAMKHGRQNFFSFWTNFCLF